MPKRKAAAEERNDEASPTPMPTPKRNKTRSKTKVKSENIPIRVADEAAYTSQQKSAISDFTSYTQADKATAAKILKVHNWHVNSAVNAYLDRGADGRVAPLQASLTKLFDKYRDDPKELPDEIGMDGTQQLLEDLSISIEDIAALVLFELVQSPSLGTIMREGWVDGWTEVGADTPAKMRNVILQRRSQLPSDREIFKNVYNHTFSLALAERQKSLPLDTAAEMWRLLFSENGVHWQSKNTPWLEWWLEYNHEKVKKAVNKDLWKQTLTFAYQTLKDDTLSFWSEDSSWPSVIDEFVEWVNKEKRSVGGDAMEIA